MLPIPYGVCYPFVEVGRTHDSLYAGKPHVVSDSVEHTRQSEANTPILQFFGQIQQLVACADVNEADRTEIQKHSLHVWPSSQRRFQGLGRMTDAREEKIAAYPPDQQPRKGNCLGMRWTSR